MKNIFKIYMAMAVLILCLSMQQVYAQTPQANASTSANRTLSNLKSPTAVNQSLVAGATDSLDLGSSSIGWRNLFLAGGIYFSNTPAISFNGSNSAIGLYSLNSISTGYSNTAVGYAAAYSNTSGAANSAFGQNALYSNLLGNNNTALGYYTLNANTVGGQNTAIGEKSLFSNTEGDYNTANGYHALYTSSDGDHNTANGAVALYSNTHGLSNVADGYGALYSNTTGNYNAGVGYETLYSSTSATGNTALGYAAGNSYANSSYNTFIGYGSDATAASLTNSTAIGNGSKFTASNQIRVGNSSVTSIGGYANWSNISDGRVKKNVRENVIGLDFINKLRPITYNLDIHEIDTRTDVKDNETDASAIAEKEKVVYSGFIAQEVEKAAKDLGYDFSGVDAPKNETDLYGLRYSDFVVPLVKAVQELSDKNQKLEERIASLEQQVSDKENTTVGSDAVSVFLGQNIPNPFDGNTTIRYSLPQQFTTAQLIITDLSGHILKTYELSKGGANLLTIKRDELVSGVYQYTLIIDGKKIDTQQMTLSN